MNISENNKEAETKAREIKTTASVVDGKLILSMPDARIPAVWQMDMEEAKSSALQVREDKEAKSFGLYFKSQQGVDNEIASYEKKQDAVDALMSISSALENAHGKIRPAAFVSGVQAAPVVGTANIAAAPVNQQDNESGGGKAGAFIAVAMICILVVAWAFSIPRASNSVLKSRVGASSASAKPQSGVPVSADAFLSGR